MVVSFPGKGQHAGHSGWGDALFPVCPAQLGHGPTLPHSPGNNDLYVATGGMLPLTERLTYRVLTLPLFAGR